MEHGKNAPVTFNCSSERAGAELYLYVELTVSNWFASKWALFIKLIMRVHPHVQLFPYTFAPFASGPDQEDGKIVELKGTSVKGKLYKVYLSQSLTNVYNF